MTGPEDQTQRPVLADEFAAEMALFAPFEACPSLAVAVSGGRDSLALILLAADWARARNGRVVALTVDHRLRAEAAEEARRVGTWLSALGIEHHVLVWQGPYPQAGLQAAARDARYRLLEDWCAVHGILHLLLGHQSGDQIETYRMRRSRQTAGAGLAGMPAIRETAVLRILRPLLSIPRDRLAATLAVRGQVWIDDPSNDDSAYERSRVRADLPDRRQGQRKIAEAAETRVAAEAAVARVAARCVALLPEGYVRLAASPVASLDSVVREMLLARCVMTAGGRIYPPRGDRLARLAADIADGRLGRGRTLGGCRIVPLAGTRGRSLLVVREAASMAGEAMIGPCARIRWDGRFDIRTGKDTPPDQRIGALGREGWRRIAAQVSEAARVRVPVPVRPVLPAIWRGGDIVAAPHLGFGEPVDIVLRFSPLRMLTDAGFAAAPGKSAGPVSQTLPDSYCLDPCRALFVC